MSLIVPYAESDSSYHGRMPISSELQAALDAAKAAAEIIQAYYRRDIRVQLKADQSPVTEADVRAEEAIRAVLSSRFPTYGFYGEETGKSALDAEYLWLVDPIDGTKAFVREYPFFSTQIALMRRGQLILGVSSAPVYGELAYAEVGKGAWLNERAIGVSNVTSIEASAISASNLKSLALDPRWTEFGQLVARASRIRGYGDFLHYHLLAAGKIDIVIESDVNILDIAALTVIVREAGGTFTDLSGNAIGLETTSVLAANSASLHEAVLKALRP